MTVAASTAPTLWALRGLSAHRPYAHDLALLSAAAISSGAATDQSACALHDAVCSSLAQTSIVWRGVQGIDAHGLWRAPDGAIWWWANTDMGSGWYPVNEVEPGALDLLLIEANNPALVSEVYRAGYDAS